MGDPTIAKVIVALAVIFVLTMVWVWVIVRRNRRRKAQSATEVPASPASSAVTAAAGSQPAALSPASAVESWPSPLLSMWERVELLATGEWYGTDDRHLVRVVTVSPTEFAVDRAAQEDFGAMTERTGLGLDVLTVTQGSDAVTIRFVRVAVVIAGDDRPVIQTGIAAIGDAPRPTGQLTLAELRRFEKQLNSAIRVD